VITIIVVTVIVSWYIVFLMIAVEFVYNTRASILVR